LHWLNPAAMEFGRSLATLLLAPVIYFFAGLPWAVAVRRMAWAPLFGAAAFGLTGELAYILGAPVSTAVVVVALLHFVAGGLILGRTAECAAVLRAELAGFAGSYAIALSPLLAAPFSIPGAWGGDWAVALASGEHILHAARFTSELLARPPLFGAASIPALLLAPPMEGFQVFCAVASACALQVFRSGLKAGAKPILVWILAGSVFFLQITANAWPKFLSAAFLLAAWQAAGGNDRRRPGLAGVLLGLAIATHQSAVLFAPLLLTRLRIPGRRIGLGQVLLILAPAGVIAGLWEIHTIAVYGWEAKLHANPSVSDRLGALSPWLNGLLVGLTTFVAWGPVEVVRHWYASPDRLSLFRIEHEIYWIATSLLNSLAGSLLGLALPWFLALGPRELWRRWQNLWDGMDWVVRASLAFALAGQMALNPFYSADGTLQTGWVPVGMALALWFAGQMADAPRPLLRTVLNRIFWYSAVPWFGFNLALTAALELNKGFRATFYDSDLERLDRSHWVSLAMCGFPWLQVLLAVLFWIRWRKVNSDLAEPVFQSI
jgi:hypothetical protein